MAVRIPRPSKAKRFLAKTRTAWRRLKRPSTANQTRSATKRAYRILHRVFLPDTPERGREKQASRIARRTRKVAPIRLVRLTGQRSVAEHKFETQRTQVSTELRGGIKLAVLAHEMTHALKLNNDKISVNAIEEYFRNRYNQHQSERGRKRRVNTSTLSEPVQAAADHPKVLEFLRGQTIRSFREVTDRPIPGVERMRLEEQRAVIFDRERQIMDGEAYALQLPTGRYELHELGESIGQRMGQIDINTGKPYAGLVALREVLRRGDANFARVEHEILEGRHDVAIAEVGRIVSEELRRGREKQFKKK